MADYSKFSDQELAVQLKEGSREAYTEIYLRYNRLLYAHVHKRINHKEEAQDLVQDVFATLWARREIAEISSNLSGYLYTAVRNKIYNWLSHKKIESEYISSLQHFLDTGNAVTDHLVREKEFAALIEHEIQSLPPRMRLIFEMSRKQHLSHKEIAAELNLSEQTVTDQVKKALKIMRPRITTLSIGLYFFTNF